MSFIKPCTIVDFCYGKNALNVRVDLAEDGRAILIVVQCMAYHLFHQCLLGGACVLYIVHMVADLF